ncbi:STY4528 family pathogenicity island replication protein [Pseudomonas fluorescens]|nr:hypothetical protein PS664_02251 [Pseudomonas fluorescens]
MCPREPQSPGTSAGDGFLFSGNRHETVPRALFLDIRLTPLERNAWQIIRLQLLDNTTTVFPSYEQLRPFLASMPCGAKASHETIAKALTMLRLSRWLSLVQRRRDAETGRLQGNLYVLHDEPLTPFETLQLDPEYLELVSHALDHLSKAVQCVAIQVLKEISDDPLLQGKLLPTRVQLLMQRLDRQSEVGQAALIRNQLSPASESEVGGKPTTHHSLRIPKQDSTVSTKAKKKLRTETVPLRWPNSFTALKPAQQSAARLALGQVDSTLQQAVLDEWSARCRQQHVHNPAGYLFGIVQKALKGEFTPWAAPAGPMQSSVPDAQEPNPRDPEIAEAHMAELRALLHLRNH